MSEQTFSDQGDPPRREESGTLPSRQSNDPEVGTFASEVTLSFPAVTERLSVAPRAVPALPGYQILRELGRGGMGVVYKARHLQLQRLVALKMILAGGYAGDEDLTRFRSEAVAIARLQHPNIVQVYEIGEHEGKPYFSLEFCSGGSLSQMLRGTPLPPREAARIVETLARAMDYAHQHDVIHRDLKPANVLVSGGVVSGEWSTDATPANQSPLTTHQLNTHQLKISDFGLCKKLDDWSQTQSGSIIGTPSYMAPEQAAGKSKEVGPAADIYALGAILYELLSGRPPFKAALPLDTVLQVISLEPVPPRQLQPETPRDLETICLKCLHKEASKRYASAAELAEDLRRFQAGEPIKARPVGRLERGWRWCRRNPRLAVLAASVLLLLMLIAVGSSVAAWLLQEERDRVLAHKVELEKTNAELLVTQDKEKKAREDAVEKLWKSYLAQARAGRWSGQAGRRFDGLDALAKAAAIRPTLELRNEAIACMALVDIREAGEWEGFPAGSVYLAFDPALRRYARSDGKGNVSVRLVTGDSEIIRLPGRGGQAWHLLFDRGGRYLVGKFHAPGDDDANWVVLWDLQEGKKVLEINRSLGSFSFSGDGQLLAVGYPDNSVRLFEVSSGKETGTRLQLSMPPHYLSFHPNESRLAVSSRSGGVHILDTANGQTLRTLSAGKAFRGVAWHPHGKLLAGAGGDARIYLWNAESGASHAVLEGHQNAVTNVAFNHAGTLLASVGWENMMWLWDPWGGKLVLRVPGVNMSAFPGPTFSADDRFLGCNIQGSKVRLWEAANAPEFFTLHTGSPRISILGSLSPDGRLLAWPDVDGTRLWNLGNHRLLAHLPGLNTDSAMFQPDGLAVITSGVSGLERWPLASEGSGAGISLKVGPRQILGKGWHGHMAVRADGQALIAQIAGGHARVYHVDRPEPPTLLRNHPNLRFVSISPNGDLAATGAWHGSGVKIWNARSGELVHSLPIGAENANVCFSPDGEWLVTATGKDGRFWKLGTWQPGGWLYRNRESDVPSSLAFSPRGDLLAVNHPNNLVRLLDPVTCQEVATLEPLIQQNIQWLSFDAAGSRLAVATSAIVQVWDLRLIRQRLQSMKLDWGR